MQGKTLKKLELLQQKDETSLVVKLEELTGGERQLVVVVGDEIEKVDMGYVELSVRQAVQLRDFLNSIDLPDVFDNGVVPL